MDNPKVRIVWNGMGAPLLPECGGEYPTNLLLRAAQALDDWITTYAHDMCEAEHVAAAWERIVDGGGTLHYAASLVSELRAAVPQMGLDAEAILAAGKAPLKHIEPGTPDRRAAESPANSEPVSDADLDAHFELEAHRSAWAKGCGQWPRCPCETHCAWAEAEAATTGECQNCGATERPDFCSGGPKCAYPPTTILGRPEP